MPPDYSESGFYCRETSEMSICVQCGRVVEERGWAVGDLKH